MSPILVVIIYIAQYMSCTTKQPDELWRSALGYLSIILLVVHRQSAIDGGTDLVIFDTTISNHMPKFDLTQHGYGHENNSGHDLTSLRGDPGGPGSHAHCGEESSGGGTSNKDSGISQRPPKELGT
ncbi:hypothetical protein K435DRAFT_849580 [Dendrothele bispora CBS 962.96]|uniref:Uncharacterized protein n=1 Tax=Dendrothele bispora (strain CBS 962.96) TaxID=1314807 RepID=A0A4S8MRT0_DENBC|nr:hypothetical protein K435DRAFT_849580 [Dendrothele bispora CBS 962.96]